MTAHIRPGKSLANYWDVIVDRWAIAWIRLDRSEPETTYRIKLTGKIQGDRDPLEMTRFTSKEEAAKEAVAIYRERISNAMLAKLPKAGAR